MERPRPEDYGLSKDAVAAAEQANTAYADAVADSEWRVNRTALRLTVGLVLGGAGIAYLWAGGGGVALYGLLGGWIIPVVVGSSIGPRIGKAIHVPPKPARDPCYDAFTAACIAWDRALNSYLEQFRIWEQQQRDAEVLWRVAEHRKAREYWLGLVGKGDALETAVEGLLRGSAKKLRLLGERATKESI